MGRRVFKENIKALGKVQKKVFTYNSSASRGGRRQHTKASHRARWVFLPVLVQPCVLDTFTFLMDAQMKEVYHLRLLNSMGVRLQSRDSPQVGRGGGVKPVQIP